MAYLWLYTTKLQVFVDIWYQYKKNTVKNSTLNTDTFSIAIFTYYICKISTTVAFLKGVLIIQKKLVREISLLPLPCFIYLFILFIYLPCCCWYQLLWSWLSLDGPAASWCFPLPHRAWNNPTVLPGSSSKTSCKCQTTKLKQIATIDCIFLWLSNIIYYNINVSWLIKALKKNFSTWCPILRS